MPPEQDHALTLAEVEEALARICLDAQAAYTAGNLPRWAKRHAHIDRLLDEWAERAHTPEPAL